MIRQALLIFVTGVLSCSVGVAGKDLEISESSWASYQWAEPWHGSWSTHTVHSQDSQTAQDFYPEDASPRELPHKQLQKRHYLHYIPLDNPEGLERPRQRHYETNGEEPLYAVWEQPPLLAKEGITSEEAVWVPQGLPLQVVKQGYTWGSKGFDESFGRHPPLVGETHLKYEPHYPSSPYPPPPPPPSYPSPPPSSSYPPPPPPPSYPPLPPPSSYPPPSSPPMPPPSSSLPSLPPPTTPLSALVKEPYYSKAPANVNKVTKGHPVPSYHPPQPLRYHPVPSYPDSPRKYYLTEEAPQRHKQAYGFRKYYLNTEPTIVLTNSEEEYIEVPVFANNEIQRPEDFTDDPTLVTKYPLITTSSLPPKDEEEFIAMIDSKDSSHDNDERSLKHKKKQSHTTFSPPYGYKLQPRPHPVSHPNYKPPPYAHYLHQRPPYPTHNVYPPTPARIRKYYLNSSASSPIHSPTLRKEEESIHGIPALGEGSSRENTSKELSAFDVYEMLRMPRSTDATSWQHTQFGSVL